MGEVAGFVGGEVAVLDLPGPRQVHRGDLPGRLGLFVGATFQGDAEFDKATFQGATSFDKAHALHLDGLDTKRVWPRGWTVHPDPTDPSRGTLVER